MARKKKNKILKREDIKPKIRIRLDKRTIISVKNMEMFKIWKQKYPDARILA